MNAINTTATNTTIPTIDERQCRTCPKMFVPAEAKFKNCPECHQAWLLEKHGAPCAKCGTEHLPKSKGKWQVSYCDTCLPAVNAERDEALRCEAKASEARQRAHKVDNLVSMAREEVWRTGKLTLEGVEMHKRDGRQVIFKIWDGDVVVSRTTYLPKVRKEAKKAPPRPSSAKKQGKKK